MDRIDSKLQETLDGIEMGNEKLIQAKKSLENGFAAKMIKFLLFANLILFFLSIIRTI
jgi:hypothetical protein